MNANERKALHILHDKYPEYELLLADLIDWLRKYNWKNFPARKFEEPQTIADEFEKSEFFKKDERNEMDSQDKQTPT